MVQHPAIEAHHLTKRFGKKGHAVQALRGVSFSVPRESVFCILGPNGAGKTTLLRILTTVTRPDSGSALIEGHDIQEDPLSVRHCIGVVSQENHFDRYLTIWHNLALHAQMHGMRPAEYEPVLKSLLQRVGLYHRRDDLTEKLSGGMQRRVALIRALIHRPKVLFLDEPTTGLDPEARREIWETIQEIKKSATVVLTTHYMEEADVLSDQIMMVHHGQKVMIGTPRELKQSVLTHQLYEVVLVEPQAEAYAAELVSQGAADLQVADPFRLRFGLPEVDRFYQLLEHIPPQLLQKAGRVEVDLEAVFMSVASSGRGSQEAGGLGDA
jgi:ABC-2 type transport system ATP-binding protein